MPARMMGDVNLSALDIRVLMAIAAHDQLGGNGTGCFASHSTLAALVDCHLKSLSRSLSALAQAGYVEARPNPLNKKTRIYSVIYSDEDAGYMQSAKAKKGNKAATYDADLGNKAATEGVETGNRSVPKHAEIGNHVSEISLSDQYDVEGNIFCEADKTSSKADKIHSGEPAPPQERRLSSGEILSQIDRKMKNDNPTAYTLNMFAMQVATILGQAEGGSQEYGWSERLLADIQCRIDEIDQEPF